ncbi:hypothetical protein [Nocardiopsis alba]|nr:hypothetical protein [Nocardiopsis alba]
MRRPQVLEAYGVAGWAAASLAVKVVPAAMAPDANRTDATMATPV